MLIIRPGARAASEYFLFDVNEASLREQTPCTLGVNSCRSAGAIHTSQELIGPFSDVRGLRPRVVLETNRVIDFDLFEVPVTGKRFPRDIVSDPENPAQEGC